MGICTRGSKVNIENNEFVFVDFLSHYLWEVFSSRVFYWSILYRCHCSYQVLIFDTVLKGLHFNENHEKKSIPSKFQNMYYRKI